MNAEPGTVRGGLACGAGRIGVAFAATLLASACAAGQLAQTSNQKTTLDGVNKSVGDIHLRGLAIQAPSGSPYYAPGTDAVIKLVIVNSGSQPDTLTSITTTAATGWSSYSTSADAKAVQAADSSAAAGLPATAGAATESPGPTTASRSRPARSRPARSLPARSSSTATPPSPSSPSATATRPHGSQAVVLPPGGRVSYGVPEAKGALLLLKTIGRLYPGNSIRVTFTFARAGSVTVTVPVQISNTPGTQTVEAPSGSALD